MPKGVWVPRSRGQTFRACSALVGAGCVGERDQRPQTPADKMAAVRAALATGKGIRRAERVIEPCDRSRGRCARLEAGGPGRAKVRGRNRITGNRSVRSQPLAPSQPPPRIAIASDVPPRGRKSEIKCRFVAQPLFRPRANANQIPQTAPVLGAPRQHSPFRAILGVLSGDLYGLIDCGLLTSGLLRRVTQGNEQ